VGAAGETVAGGVTGGGVAGATTAGLSKRLRFSKEPNTERSTVGATSTSGTVDVAAFVAVAEILAPGPLAALRASSLACAAVALSAVRFAASVSEEARAAGGAEFDVGADAAGGSFGAAGGAGTDAADATSSAFARRKRFLAGMVCAPGVCAGCTAVEGDIGRSRSKRFGQPKSFSS